jgi:paraquat-inducible protein A
VTGAIPAPRFERVPALACHHCGLLQTLRAEPAAGEVAACARCGSRLFRHLPDGLTRSLHLNLAALVLFIVAHSFPLITLKMQGREQTSTIFTGVIDLVRDGMWPLALVVLLTATIFPFARLAAGLAVLVPLQLGFRPAWAAPVFRRLEELKTWAMMEVYLLGLIVAYVKLTDLARLELGVAAYAFVATILLMVWAEAALEPHEVWRRLAPQARVRPDAPPAGLIACHDCGQLVQVSHGHGRCPRCAAPVHERKPESLQRTWALLIAAAILYVPANVYPIMAVTSLGTTEADTILSGVVTLLDHGMLPIAALVFFASIVVPVLKLLGLGFLLLSVQRGWTWRRRDRTRLYRIVELSGRWSMVDIFVISILVALVNLEQLATIQPGIGAIAFASVVIITMIASQSFDPRLIWDPPGSRR